MTLSPGQRLGPLQILGVLGAGGMGEVYRARDTKLGREVAVKVLPDVLSHDPARMARFEREAKALAALNHSSVATIHGLEEHEGRPYLVMELVEGETLAERIARGPLNVEEAVALFEAIAEALEAAHEKGIVHRDLKPSNVMVTPAGKVKLLDFGLAKLAEPEPPPADEKLSRSPTLTRGTALGAILGTASYMSPEQARGSTVDRRTDIWAFGCCLYEALTGRKAFDGETITDVLASIVKNDPDWEALPRSTPSSFRRLLRRCLQKDPRERLRDIGDARFELRESRDRSPAREMATRRPRAIPAIAAVVGAALLSGFVTWRLVDRPASAPNRGGRFEIGLLPGQQLIGPFTNPLALSPDGTKLVFVGDGPRALYLRDLNSYESRRLPGTDGAASPFFSPDGQWVAFFAEGKLKKVLIAGGRPLEVASAPGAHMGGSWAFNDTIFFADAFSGGLFRVPASGGVAEKITEPRRGEGEAAHGWPQRLIDGETLLFTVETGEGPFNALLSLGTGEWRRILPGEEPGIARYSPSGHLLKVLSGGLVAIPFDARRGEPVGAAVPVLDEVYSSVSGVSWFALSDAGTLVYVHGTKDRNRLLWVDRDGRSTPAIQDTGNFNHPRLSPDGDRVAVSIHSGVRSDIWIYDLAREVRIRFTSTGRNNLFPVWSPDGRRIAFAANRSGVFHSYWAPSDGSGKAERVGPEETPLVVSSWSSDGRELAFHSVPEGDLLLVSTDENGALTPFLATPFMEKSAIFSPDGRFIAYVSNESGSDEIYVQPFPGPGEIVPVSAGGGRAPVWSHDGRELYYRNGSAMMTVSVTTEGGFRAGRPRQLFEGRYGVEPGGQHDYDVSPDGQRFLMVGLDDEAEPSEIRVVLSWFEEVERLAPAP